MYKNLLFLCAMFFAIQATAQIDTTIGRTAPSNVSKDYKTLTQYLCEGLSTDQQKANAIYNWVTSNLDYDIKEEKNPDKEIPEAEDVMKKPKTISMGYNRLFVAMCQEAGMRALIIHGYYRSRLLHNDSDVIPITHTTWCGVQIDGDWHLVSPLLGAGGSTYSVGWVKTLLNSITNKDNNSHSQKEKFIKKYSTKGFMMDPIQTRVRRLPADPLWQLTKDKMPMSTFIAGDSAIASYNDEHNTLARRNAQLDKIGDYTEEQQIIDCGDRAYRFNTLNFIMLSDKEAMSANELVEPYTSGQMAYNINTIATFRNAVKKLERSCDYIDSQKTILPAYFINIKRKNSGKNRLAKDRIRTIKMDTRSEQSDFKRRISPAESKKGYYEQQIEKNNEDIKSFSADDIYKVETIKYQRPATDPMLVAKLDSIAAKMSRVEQYGKEIDDILIEVNGYYEVIDNTLESYRYKLGQCAQILKNEVYTRSFWYDSYDDNVIYHVSLYDSAWKNDLVLFNTTYFRAYDSSVKRFAQVARLYKAQLRLYKSVLRDYKQYKRLNDELKDFDKTYQEVATRYSNCLKNFNATLDNYNNFYSIYISAANGVLDKLKEYDEQVEELEEIEQERDNRANLTLEEHRLFIESWLDRMLNKRKQMITNLQEILDKDK